MAWGGTGAAKRRRGWATPKKKQWAEAEQAFKEAWALKQSYDIAGNLGDVELFLGKHREAAEHLEYSLRNWPAGQEAAKKRTAERFAEAKKSVGTLSLKVSEGAEITVNGKSVGKSPLPGPVFVDAGAATIEAKIGDKSAKKTIAMDVGESRELEIVIAGEAAPVGGGDPNGGTSGAGGAAQGGGNGDGGTATPGGNGKPGPNTTWLVVGGGVVVLGLAAGVGFTMASSSKASDRDDERSKLPGPSPCGAGTPYKSQCSDIGELDDDAKRLGAYGIAGFAVAGAAAIATATYWLWPREKKTASSVRLAPLLSVGAGGLSVSSAF